MHKSPASDESLEQRLGYHFRRREWLTQALTHSSWAGAAAGGVGRTADNERLEFLGDAVLGLRVSQRLLELYPAAAEGELTRLRSWLVSAPNCAEAARRLALGECLRLGRGEESLGGRQKQRLLANAWEAILGAIFLDGGYEPAAGCVDRWLLEPSLSQAPAAVQHQFGYKSALQEWAHAHGHALPVYRIVTAAGPEHEPSYTIEVSIAGCDVAQGVGRTKKTAEQQAAAALLRSVRG